MNAWTWVLDSKPAPTATELDGPPSRWLYLTEPARGVLALHTAPLALPWLARGSSGRRPRRGRVARAHGHRREHRAAPGLSPRARLSARGAGSSGATSGRRSGRSTACGAIVRELADSTGSPVSLVGWSLGGIYARELAREDPTLVRRVVTLGSPFGLTEPGAEPGRARLPAAAHLHSSASPPVPRSSGPSPCRRPRSSRARTASCSWRSCIGTARAATRTSRCAAPTSASASTRPPCGRSPTVLPNQPRRTRRSSPPGWLRWLYPSPT